MRTAWGIGAGLLCWCMGATAQITNTGFADSTGGIRLGNADLALGAGLDVYRNFSGAADEEALYLVSSTRLNEWNINLAFLDVRYRRDRIRGRLMPGFGSYMERNYAPGDPRLIEGNVGFRPFKRHPMWVDFGILGSPFTNETPLSRDHLTYTRSLSAEFVPYYLSGARVSLPLGEKTTVYGYWVNGWQHIGDPAKGSAGIVQVELRPHPDWLLNVNGFLGREIHATALTTDTRYFVDAYLIHARPQKLRLTSSAYAGLQSGHRWYQANLICEQTLRRGWSLSARAEWFRDPQGVVLPLGPAASSDGLLGFALGAKVPIDEHVLVRAEYRTLQGQWTASGPAPFSYFTLHCGFVL